MAKMLDDGSSTPLYAQLRELLKGQIVDGAFVPGERGFPPRTSSTACMA